jgi:hypothetical protein
MTTPEIQIARLPKWVQEHIADIQRQRDVAVRELNRWVDAQTPSPVRVLEMVCLGEGAGPSIKTRFVQTRTIEVLWKNVYLKVYLAESSAQRQDSIELQWGQGEEMHGSGMAALVPTSFQSALIISPKNMRTIP